ncbi:MAG: site-2 protease family protein [Candidatus Omnitrophota bacterium]
MENMLLSVTVFIIVIVIHELAHGCVAYLFGDRTAKDAGRITLNPFAHADLVGTFVVPGLLLISRSPVIFGWAKPVPVNPYNFRNPRAGMFFTSLAGPAANFLMAFIFSLVLKSGLFAQGSLPGRFIFYGVVISIILGVFNIIPIPPLDGANILFSLLPASIASRFVWLERYGFVILICFLYLGLFDRIILPLTGVVTRFFTG